MAVTEDRRERVLYVEDDRLVRLAFARAFSDLRVELASTFHEGKARLGVDSHAAWIVDEHLPDGSGTALIEWARNQGLWTPALLVTGVEDRTIVNRAQLLGIEIAIKPEMTLNVRAFLARARAARSAGPAVLRAVDAFAQKNAVSPRERDLLRAIGRGIPRAALDAELGLSENTVKTLVRRILRKTGTDSLDDVLRLILAGDPGVDDAE